MEPKEQFVFCSQIYWDKFQRSFSKLRLFVRFVFSFIYSVLLFVLKWRCVLYLVTFNSKLNLSRICIKLINKPEQRTEQSWSGNSRFTSVEWKCSVCLIIVQFDLTMQSITNTTNNKKKKENNKTDQVTQITSVLCYWLLLVVVVDIFFFLEKNTLAI